MELIEIGIINNTHGLKGEMKFTPWSNSADDVLDLSEVVIEGKTYGVVSMRKHKDKVLLVLEGINSIEEAECFKNKIINIDKKLFLLDEDSYFIDDLVGVQVENVDNGFIYGTLKEILITGANDVYSVVSEANKEYLIPAIDDCIIDVDLDKRIMKIRPLEGLFD